MFLYENTSITIAIAITQNLYLQNETSPFFSSPKCRVATRGVGTLQKVNNKTVIYHFSDYVYLIVVIWYVTVQTIVHTSKFTTLEVHNFP